MADWDLRLHDKLKVVSCDEADSVGNADGPVRACALAAND
jgi:hypothetical protein